MYKKIVLWIFFTVIAGLLPTGFVLLACNVTNTSFSVDMICSEIFFFDLIMAADGLKEIYSVKRYRKTKVTLFSIMLFVLIILSVIYGILLLNNYAEDTIVVVDNLSIYSVDYSVTDNTTAKENIIVSLVLEDLATGERKYQTSATEVVCNKVGEFVVRIVATDEYFNYSYKTIYIKVVEGGK